MRVYKSKLGEEILKEFLVDLSTGREFVVELLVNLIEISVESVVHDSHGVF